ncbi:MAG TPA: ferredoxin-thioredoxin reductase catalytic domain-containing protein [Candidatus Binatia bacterium]|nr:ferredoxin-thioredoxin reductase catalytic domain-containing protein [Candidatus Binatia bacterium]
MTRIEETRRRAESDAKTYGYYLTPQPDLLQMFLEGLKTNEDRYGYPSCPCRLATGNFDIDRDIICPCDYRDPDVAEFGACYCRLYVNKAVYESKNLPEVPERRPLEKQGRAYGIPSLSQQGEAQGVQEKAATFATTPTPTQPPKAEVKKKLWYCKQCGYVVYREDPPYVCPICKAKREMFAEIEPKIEFKG